MNPPHTLESKPVVVVHVDSACALWRDLPEAMQQAVVLVDGVVDQLLDQFGGTRIEAPSLDLAASFGDVVSAVEWALALDTALVDIEWPPAIAGHRCAASYGGLGVSAGVDVGVLSVRIAALSGRTFSQSPSLDAAAKLAQDCAPGLVALGPAAVDLLMEDSRADALSWLDRLREQPTLTTVASERLCSDAAAPREPSTDAHTNLPDFSGSFVDRVGEFNAIAKAMAASRRVAICGPAGAGKSRLSVEFARQWMDESAVAGVQAWFCDLSQVSSAAEATFQIARTTGVQIPTSEELSELDSRLISSFDERGPLLLILDDIDSVDAGFEDSITRWLEGTQNLCVLTTGQRRPLTDGPVPDDRVVGVDALGHHSARALLKNLLERPLPVSSEPRDTLDLIELADACGRLPLALELVARSAHQRPGPPGKALLRPGELASSATASADKPAPANELERALLRTWQMLDGDQRAALQACTVFADNFSSEAAISVIEAGTSADADARQLFSVLCQFSLLRPSPKPAIHPDARHVLLAPIRDFAHKRAPEALLESARQKHLEFFSRWAHTLCRELEGADERQWLQLAQAELPNLYRASNYGRQRDMGLWITVLEALSEVNVRIGPLGGLRERIDEVVERAIEADLPDLELRARRIRGQTLMWTGLYAQAEADYRVVRRIAVDSGDREAAAHALSCYGFAMGLQGKENEGLNKVRQALEDVGQSESFLTIEMLTNAAIVARNRVQIDEATGYLHEALLRARRRQNAFSQASVLFFLGTILRHNHQKWDEAIRYQEEAHDLFSTIGDRRGRLVCYHELATCYTATDQLERAERCYGEATALASMMGDREYSAVFWFGRGRSRFGRADYAAAEPDLLEASLALEEVGHIHLRLANLLYLAATYGALERVSEARAYFDQVEAIFDETDITRERPLFEVMYGYLDAALARAAMRAGDDSGARKLLESAYERTTCAPGDDEPAQQSVRREASRLLVYLDECVERGELPADASPNRSVLRVCEEMRWFAVDDDEPVDISRRGPIRRVLRALVQRRIDQPGETMTSDEILEAGWPDEVLTAQSASQRLYTTISRMRSLGMQDVLETFDGEYLIAPTYMPVWVTRSG